MRSVAPGRKRSCETATLLKKYVVKKSFSENLAAIEVMRNIASLKSYLFPTCSFSENVDAVQKHLLGKSSSSVDLFILNNSHAKEVAVPKSNCPEELSILKKWLLARSFTLKSQKVAAR